MKPRDIITIVAVVVLFSPVAYMIMLLLTNNARIEFGEQATEQLKALESIRPDFKSSGTPGGKDTLLAQYSKTFAALQEERKVIESEREHIGEQRQRLDMMQKELELKKNALTEERQKLEKLVQQSDVLEQKRIKQLARVYSAMRPAEAAQILETLDDSMLAAIIQAMGDERQKAKIMSSISKDKASRVSKNMGSNPIQ